MAKSAYEIIKSILRTEKSTGFYEPQNKYLFLVERAANKYQIKKAIEELYNVKVKKVNTMIYAGKLKRVRYQEGRTPAVKKAIVTLKEGYKIEVG
ncbi:MAG: 50S ribosomal protein L23 [Candidatus Omnitrophica bacterium]|nr:50S ribosomal protein L23 [Candidatus Omnitrophota bacterium]